MAEFRMPSLGADMQTGTLLEWRVKPGDRVRRGDIIAVVDTDKAAIEIEVYEDGIVESLLVHPGQTVEVGTVMAVIRTQGGQKTAASDEKAGRQRAAAAAEPVKKHAVEPPAQRQEPVTRTGRLRISPYARRLAAERGVDPNTLEGAGPKGAISAADVEKAAAASDRQSRPSPDDLIQKTGLQHETPPPLEAFPAKDYQTAMRRAIAAAMARSKREIPHYYLQTRVDMSRTLDWLTSKNAKLPVKDRILPVVPLLRAVALALGDVPELNGFWVEDRHQVSEAIHIGFAISLRQGGLIAPALLNADGKDIDALMAALRDLVQRARNGGLRGREMTDATVTVTNLGDLGVEAAYGVIYPPQVALVSFGKTMDRPWAENGLLGVRPVLTATLSADHRATDGHRGAQFLDAVNRYLQEPLKL